MISFLRKESRFLQDTGHSALSAGLHILLGCAEGRVLCGEAFSTESFSLFGLQGQRVACPNSTHQGGRGHGLGGGFLHKAVLSVSLSISSRMWPGTSLLAESECISGKMLRSGSETLELVSVTILEAVRAALAMLLSPAGWALGG